MDDITANDIEVAIDLIRRKVELELMIHLTRNKPKNQNEILNRLNEIEAQLIKINEKFSNANFIIALPNEDGIAKLISDIKKIPMEEVVKSARLKSGNFYDYFKLLKSILLSNHENRSEIAKMNVLLKKITSKEKEKILLMVKEGNPDQDFSRFQIDAKLSEMLERLMRRVANKETNEVSLIVNQRKVWVKSNFAQILNNNSNKIVLYSTKLQILVAEKQKDGFDELKEKEFRELQKEYLKLLHEQDELLKEFNEEREYILNLP